MNKKYFKNFIDKYYLGGLCESVKVISKDNKIATNFQTQEKDLIGFVTANDIPIESGVFGVFNTGLLLKGIGLFNDELEVNLNEEHGKFTKMVLKDSNYEMSLLLADLDIIPETKKIAELPPISCTINIDNIFIDKFLKSKTVLSDSEVMALVQKDNSIDIILNYAEFNTDNVKFNMPATFSIDLDNPIKLNSNKVKEILAANRDCLSGTIDIIKEGLVVFKFNCGNIITKYLLVMLS
jgi:hypothetical protein